MALPRRLRMSGKTAIKRPTTATVITASVGRLAKLWKLRTNCYHHTTYTEAKIRHPGHQWSVSSAVEFCLVVTFIERKARIPGGGPRIACMDPGVRRPGSQLYFCTFFSYLFRAPSWKSFAGILMQFWSILAAILFPFWPGLKMKPKMRPHLQQAKTP